MRHHLRLSGFVDVLLCSFLYMKYVSLLRLMFFDFLLFFLRFPWTGLHPDVDHQECQRIKNAKILNGWSTTWMFHDVIFCFIGGWFLWSWNFYVCSLSWGTKRKREPEMLKGKYCVMLLVSSQSEFFSLSHFGRPSWYLSIHVHSVSRHCRGDAAFCRQPSAGTEKRWEKP